MENVFLGLDIFFRVTCFFDLLNVYDRFYDFFFVNISLQKIFLSKSSTHLHPSKVKWLTPYIRFNSNKSQTLPGHLIVTEPRLTYNWLCNKYFNLSLAILLF